LKLFTDAIKEDHNSHLNLNNFKLNKNVLIK